MNSTVCLAKITSTDKLSHLSILGLHTLSYVRGLQEDLQASQKRADLVDQFVTLYGSQPLKIR